MDLQDWDTVFGIAQKTLTILGMIAGAIWTYFHYFRGRTYRPRLETSVAGQIIKQNETLFLVTKLKIKNVGLSKIDLEQSGTGMRIIGIESQDKVQKITKYQGVRLKTVPILENHSWIEPGETIDDVHTFILPKEEFFSIKLDVRLITKGIAWRFSSVEQINESNNLVKQEV